jgi:hypothetical protein
MPKFALCWFAMTGCCKPSTVYSQGGKPQQSPGQAVNRDEALSVSQGLKNNLGFLVDRHPQRSSYQPPAAPYGASGNDNSPRFEHHAIAQNQAKWMLFYLHETIDERT